jgi:pyrimidine operon attenuation protein/uracil phosphoribosyltransferase
MAAETTQVRDARGVDALVTSLASNLLRALGDARDVALVGIRRGGVALAGRLRDRLRAAGLTVDLGTADIGLYRDDAHLALPRPTTAPTDILFPVDGRHVVIVDDVFWTGRTARAALDEVLDFGRPRRLWLVTLVVRPGRELPIVPDISALSLEPAPTEKVELRLTEDGHPQDALVLVRRSPA